MKRFSQNIKAFYSGTSASKKGDTIAHEVSHWWQEMNSIDFHSGTISCTNEDLNNLWVEKTKHLPPNVGAYIFSYEKSKFYRTKGLNDLFGWDSAVPFTYGSTDFLNRVIEEQRYLYEIEVRRASKEIFSDLSSLFLNDYGLHYSMQITIIDRNGEMWHANNVIQPISYVLGGKSSSSSDPCDSLHCYFGYLQFISKADFVPFQSCFQLNVDLGSKNSPELKTVNKMLNLIKADLSRLLGFKKSDMDLAIHSRKLLSKSDIILKPPYCNSEKRIELVKRDVENHRRRLSKTIKENFPIFSSHTKNKEKEEVSFELLPRKVAHFCEITGFDNYSSYKSNVDSFSF